MNSINQPLSGIKVVEFGTHVAVPTAARIMASWGAEVIKIEHPDGDAWRRQGRVFKTKSADDENPIFMVPNANKSFIGLDVKAPDARKILVDMIKNADVFMSSVRLPALHRLGLDYEEIKKINPGLIYLYFTSFGSRGRDAARGGLDTAVFWGRSGALADWVPPGAFPVKPFPGTGDSCSASMILSAILAALLGRTKTGKGTLITSSLFGNAVWYNAVGVVSAQEAYGDNYPKTEYDSVTPFAHIYRCADGEWIFLCMIDYDRYREKMFRIFGLEEYLKDNRFLTIDSVHEHMEEIIRLINERFLTKTSDEWAEIFEAEDCIYQKLVHAKDVTRDAQAWENGYLEEFTFSNGHKAALPQIPVTFSAYQGLKYKATGPVGSDTDRILAEMGYTAADIKNMRTKKIIR